MGSAINLMTFGYKFGPPAANFVFDVSFLSNPARHGADTHLDSDFSEWTVDFCAGQPGAAEIVETIVSVGTFVTTLRVDHMIAIGCNGGRHRSVAVSRLVRAELEKIGHGVNVTHRERARDGLH